ncbi:hypothetical protein [Micromonospora sp. DT63]|uniref:hypothetical protein n=1 Tax=Micromonospora sp. DT63 TaxID=3393441 RepID=UPI003CF13C53
MLPLPISPTVVMLLPNFVHPRRIPDRRGGLFWLPDAERLRGRPARSTRPRAEPVLLTLLLALAANPSRGDVPPDGGRPGHRRPDPHLVLVLVLVIKRFASDEGSPLTQTS